MPANRRFKTDCRRFFPCGLPSADPDFLRQPDMPLRGFERFVLKKRNENVAMDHAVDDEHGENGDENDGPDGHLGFLLFLNFYFNPAALTCYRNYSTERRALSL